MPSPERDAAISGRQLALMAFPAPGHAEPEKYGSPRTRLLNAAGELAANPLVWLTYDATGGVIVQIRFTRGGRL